MNAGKPAVATIQIVLPFTSLTGGCMVLVELANRLAARGHKVRLLHRHPDIPWWKPRGWLRTWLRDRGVLPWITWHPVDVPVARCPTFDARHVPDADIILASYWRDIPAIAALPASKGRKIYFVQALESDFVEEPERKAEIDATYRADMEFVVVADWIGEVLREKHGREWVKISPPLADQMLVPPTRSQDSFRGRCLMQDHKPLAKGVDDGIRAFELAREQCPELTLSLFGPHSLNRDTGHSVLGQVATRDMPALYDDYDLFIWPSTREGFGLPPLEAMARGLAVATTDNGGSREFATHEETALVSPAGDPEVMAANILRLASDTPLRNRLAANGMKLARSQFTWQRVCEQFEKLMLAKLYNHNHNNTR